MTKQRGGLDQAALIFERAHELEGDARRAYLDEACHGNATLRADILSMLEAKAGQGEFLSDPTLSVSAPISEGPGTVFGHYKLLQLIGEGGFGVVYLAEQTEPVRRKVALKIIKLGMDTKQVIARFEVERQALAMMDHPNIAKVLDAGATETGRPYFVMELVKGVPITEYCDAENLATSDRLELLTRVCNAVQHAHQKG
ncbi:MAG: protein kinase, partial [Planctomycetes bacterium]|nr:protein kinase [Planctomycetota bacterium]